MENVDNDMPVIEDRPASLIPALAPPKTKALTGHELINTVRKGGYLVVCPAGRDDHMVTQNGQVGDVQDNNVLGLPAVKKLGETKYGFLILHSFSS